MHTNTREGNMMGKKIITLKTSLVIVLTVCLLNCERKSSSQTQASEYNIWGTVSDKQTRQPIADAIVYYGGTGSLRIRTDNEGKYLLNVPWGNVYLNAFKTEYRRVEQRLNMAQNDIREVNFELEQKDAPVEQMTIIGTLELRIVHAGSRSEDRYLELYPLNSKAIMIFDEIGMNDIRIEAVATKFGLFVGKLVAITGFYEIGYIGWKREEANGIYVEEIKLAQ